MSISHWQTNLPTVTETPEKTIFPSLFRQGKSCRATHSPPLLRSLTYLALESFQRAPATIRAIGALFERRFADFADIPYQDACTQQELSRLLDECSIKGQSEYSTQRDAGVVNSPLALRKDFVVTGVSRGMGYEGLSAQR
jgi:hypothetical protein